MQYHRVLPWKRAHLNIDFLKHEKKRIEKLKEWRSSFLKKQIGEKLEEVSFYTVPLELDSSWKGSIANQGSYNYVGMSGLYNCPQIVLVAIFPSELKQPSEYSLINITKATKIIIE